MSKANKVVVTKDETVITSISVGDYSATLTFKDGKFSQYDGPEHMFLIPEDAFELLIAVANELKANGL